MAPKRARPRSHLLGGERHEGAGGLRCGAAAESVSPPSAVFEIQAGSSGLDGRACDRARVHPPGFAVDLVNDRADLTPADALSSEPGGSLPCLSSNNCNGDSGKALSQQQKKSAVALAWNVQHMAEKYGLERLGFLTLTFADHVLLPVEAQRRFHSLRTGVLGERYEAFLRVFERQKSGRIHYHLLVVLPFDARTGVDFEAFSRGDYRSASQGLRSEWAFWRAAARAYRFGRTELMPVRSTEEGIGRYVGKYISKHHAVRKEEDRGVRLVEYSRGARMARTRFGWCSDGAATWRAKVRLFAQIMGARDGCVYSDVQQLSGLNSRWAYWYRSFIAALPVISAPLGYRYDAEGLLIDIRTGEIVAKSTCGKVDDYGDIVESARKARAGVA